jgi:hypothetical protein
MKRRWETDELVDHWTLLPAELALLANKTGATRPGFAVLLKSFQLEARFPQRKQDVPGAVVVFIAKQIGVAPEEFLQYQWRGRTIEYHRAQIRAALGFRQATEQDEAALAAWLAERALVEDRDPDRLRLRAYERCRALGLEPPAPGQVDRLVRSVLRSADDHFCATTVQRLSPTTVLALEALLRPAAPSGVAGSEPGRAAWTELKADPGPPTLATVLAEIAKLERLRALGLPDDLFARVPPQSPPGVPAARGGGRDVRAAPASRPAAAHAAGHVLLAAQPGTDRYPGRRPAAVGPLRRCQGRAEGGARAPG